ncbi:MAG: hypothetical protein K9I74_01320, partial [Bacteroidales bacterium]|nr:hypothetical protein [Bacteroidales bacterium]
MKKNLFILAAVISIILSSCDSFYNEKGVSSFRFIPTRSALVLETNNFLSLWNTYSKSSIWDIKKNNPGLQKVYNNLQTLKKLTSRHKSLKSAMSESSVLLSVVNTKENPALLMVTQASLTMKKLKAIVR